MNNTILVTKIREYADKQARLDDEDFNPSDSSGGNFDDCFSAGIAEGYILFARDLLRHIDNDI